jgi:hypothetical protein
MSGELANHTSVIMLHPTCASDAEVPTFWVGSWRPRLSGIDARRVAIGMPFAVIHQTCSGPIPVATFEALRDLAIVARLGATRINAAVAKPLVEDGFTATIAIVVSVRLFPAVTHLAPLREHGMLIG